MKIALFAFSLASLLFNSCLSQPQRFRGKHQTILIDNTSREYIYFVPPNTSNKKLPIIIALHGGGGTAKVFERTSILFNKRAVSEGAVIIYPQAINKSWNAGDIPTYSPRNKTDANDVKFIEYLIDLAIGQWSGNPDRIYLTGPSRGGIMSFFLADTLNHRITAISPVMASLNESMFETYSYDRPISVLAINGTKDPLILYEGGAANMWKNKDLGPEATIVPIETLMKHIAQMNGCDTSYEIVSIPDKNKRDSSYAENWIFQQCPHSASTIFVKVVGGGHTYPGGIQYLPKSMIGVVNRDFNSMEMIWDFFMNN